MDFDENDSFWSLDSMLPKSKDKPAPPASGKSTETTELVIDGNQKGGGEKIDFSSWLAKKAEGSEQKNGEVFEYTPKNPLIKSVRVTRAARQVKSTERFLVDGRALLNAEGEFCGNEPLESVFPQYARLTDAQKKCYIGFRTEVRAGRFPIVSLPYIYLYLYELINFDEIAPQKRAEQMSELLIGYSELDEKLFSDICRWLADLCLVYGIPIPDAVFGDIHTRVLKHAAVKEIFALKSTDGAEDKLYGFLLSTSRYDARASKFYPEYKKYYDEYIDKAVCYALTEIARRDSHLAINREDTVRLTREAFFGAYKTAGAYCTVTVECLCITHSDEEKRMVSELVRYAENCVRSALGIKQRLTVSYLPLDKKELVKSYIREHLTVSVQQKRINERVPEIPEYEKLYEPKSERVSFADAEKIEESSWSVTEKLVTAFDGEEYEEAPTPDAPEKEETVAPVTPENAIMDGLLAVFEGDNERFKQVAGACGYLPAALADMINDMLLDEIGDVALEEDGNGYKISEWYKDEIKEMLGI